MHSIVIISIIIIMIINRQLQCLRFRDLAQPVSWSFHTLRLPPIRCAMSPLLTEWRYQNFDRNRYRDFFYDTKFSETETFFRDQIFPKPKPILFFRDQIFRNRNRDFFPRPNFSETETFFPRPNFSKPKPNTRGSLCDSSDQNCDWCDLCDCD